MDRDQTGAAWPTLRPRRPATPRCAGPPRQLTEENKAWLRQLPQSMRVTVAGRSVYLFHGSPLRHNEYLWADAAIAVLRADRQRRGRRPVLLRPHPRGVPPGRGAGALRRRAARSAAGPMATRARDTRSSTSASRTSRSGFRSVDYDHVSVVRDMAAAGQPIDLLREPPAEHPHLRPSRRLTDRSGRPLLGQDFASRNVRLPIGRRRHGRPTTPARTMIVTTYGRTPKIWFGNRLENLTELGPRVGRS